MYYEEINKLTGRELYEYKYEYFDDRPRCTWYRLAEDCTKTIESNEMTGTYQLDILEETEECHLKALVWVYENDKEAIQFLLSNRIHPVAQAVKDLLIGLCMSFSFVKEYHLKNQSTFESIIEKLKTKGDNLRKIAQEIRLHLRSFQYPPEIIYARVCAIKKKRFNYIILTLRSGSSSLKRFHEEWFIFDKDDKNQQILISHPCNFSNNSDCSFLQSIEAFEWLHKNEREYLTKVVKIEVLLEMYDQFIRTLKSFDKHEVIEYFSKVLKIKSYDEYITIPSTKDYNFYQTQEFYKIDKKDCFPQKKGTDKVPV